MSRALIAVAVLLLCAACAKQEDRPVAGMESGGEAGAGAGYRRFVARSHETYRRDLNHIKVSEVAVPSASAPASRRGGVRMRAAASRQGRTAAAFQLSPTTPVAGSPEWRREQDYADRRERALRDGMRRICANC